MYHGEKELPEADVAEGGRELLELCHRYGVKLIWMMMWNWQ